MKWPWQHERQEPAPASEVPTDTLEGPSEDLQRAREAYRAAQEALSRARRQRAQVAAASQALERTATRNHLAELVRSALGSG